LLAWCCCGFGGSQNKKKWLKIFIFGVSLFWLVLSMLFCFFMLWINA
jgi:hypothetical protein